MAKDFFTLFVFFELLGLFSAMLVIHEEDKKAKDATKLYIWFAIIGGLVLLLGIVLLFAYTGKIGIEPMATLLSHKVPPLLRYLIPAFMIFGFGAKAGIFMLHVWLPEAHPVAPTPASALLSGVMIKAGAYGILRTVNTLFAPAVEKAESVATHAASTAHNWTTLTSLGYALICIGVITMFFGVVNALLSPNCKRMLAYHSVSQMGYIVFGLGCAAYLGKEGAMGLAGGLYHIVNHALFKGSLFLCVGAVYFRTRELDMYKLGGLWRNMPFTAVACFIAVCGISGVPFFNGFASKTILHHGALEVIQHSAKLTASGRPDVLLVIAEIFFILTAFGTFCSNMKMWLFVFMWRRPEKFKDVEQAPLSMKIALGAMSVAILFIGLRPNFLLEKIIGPALASFGFESASHAYHILYNTHVTKALHSTIPILYDPRNFSFLSSSEAMHNLLVGGIEVLGGAMFFILGYRFGWFGYHPPEWTAVAWWYTRLADGFYQFSSAVNTVYCWSMTELARVFALVEKGYVRFKTHWPRKYHQLVHGLFLSGPRARERRIIGEIEDKLEEERRELIREAIREVIVRAREIKLSKRLRQKRLDQARAVAIRMANRVVAEKLVVIRRLIHEVPAEIVVGAIEPASEKMKMVGKDLAKIASLAVEEKEKGKEHLVIVTEKLAKTMTQQRFDSVLKICVDEYNAMREKYHKTELALSQRISKWIRAMTRVFIEVVTEERVPWMIETRYSQEEIARTRRSIKQYTRDMSFNIVIIAATFVLFALSLLVYNR